MCDSNDCLMLEVTNEQIQDFIDTACQLMEIDGSAIDWWWDDETEMGNTWGACYGDWEEQTIEINCSTPRKELWEVIAHELIHCKQHQQGALNEAYEGVVVPGVWWKDLETGETTFYECMDIYAYINHPVTDQQIHDRYMSYPWEQEAYAGQSLLAFKTLNAIKRRGSDHV